MSKARTSSSESLSFDLFGGAADESAAERVGAALADEIPQPGQEPPTPPPGREPLTPEPGREHPTPQPGREPSTPQPGREPPTPQPGREPPTQLPGTPMPPPPPTAAGAKRSEARGPEREVWTVSQVNRAVRNLLEGTLPPVWVSGEVAGWKRAGSGHCYFTLKDRHAQLRCVMWRTEAERMPLDPDEGTEVRVLGTLTVYEPKGDYQLVVRTVEAGGAEGLWRLAFERLRKKLDGEGLFATERKREPPRSPASVGLVTSVSGAAIKDVLTTIRRLAPWTRVLVRNVRVQGNGAALEVAEGIRALSRSGRVDVVIVARGGGSIEDLWAFNEEPVARAIAQSPVPVISGVGHEVDVTIADLVADLRAATPSAAAELAVRGSAVTLEGLRTLPPRLVRALRGSSLRRQRRLTDARAALARALTSTRSARRSALTRASERLEKDMRWMLARRRSELVRSAGKLEALSPLATLQRGYAVALSSGLQSPAQRSRPSSRGAVRATRRGRPRRLSVRGGAARSSRRGSGLMEPPIGLEASLRRLEEIVSALEADEVELERALALFEEGVGHVRRAEAILTQTELRVEELLGDGPSAVTRPLRIE